MAKIDDLKKNLDKILKHFGVAKQELAPTEDQTIRRKYEQLQKQKLIDSLKCDTRTDHIKSVGNGI